MKNEFVYISSLSMNNSYRVKEEYQGLSSRELAELSQFLPQPMEGLHDVGPPAFLTKTYDMVDDMGCNHIVSWSEMGKSFVVWDPHAFSTYLLPRFFKHNNFSSFVRQLNTYGFRKVDPDKWEFANEGFSWGQRHMLRSIRRKKTPSQHQLLAPRLELGKFGVNGELNSFSRNKQVLTMELVKLREQQQNTKTQLQAMEVKLQITERKQQQMMKFMARAMQNPNFMKQLIQPKEKRKELEDAINKKRQRPIDQGESSRSGHYFDLVKADPLKFEDFCGYEVSELEALALEMQGFGKARSEQDEDAEQFDGGDRDTEDGFWEELLNDRISEESGYIGEKEGEEEYVDVFANIGDKVVK